MPVVSDRHRDLVATVRRRRGGSGEPLVAPDHGLRIASLIDLAGMKAAVVQKRAEAKDYVDLDALIRSGGVDLPTALAAGQAIYGCSFNPQITLKALCYFGDGDLKTLPEDLKTWLVQAVRAVDLDHLPTIGDGKSPSD